jgi:hypothetical protein
MRQIITRLDDVLAEQVKQRAEADGLSVNALVTSLLEEAVSEQDRRMVWKRRGLQSGLLVSGRKPSRRKNGGGRVPPARLSEGYLDAILNEDRGE